MKRIITVLLAVTMAVVLITAAQAQDDMRAVANDAFSAPQRPPARFNHDAHNEAAAIDECRQCHHVYQDGQLVQDESSEDQRCSDCHAEKADGRQPALMDAFHANCKGCHEQNGQGPVMCGECHQR